MNVLITGVTGLLGRALSETAPDKYNTYNIFLNEQNKKFSKSKYNVCMDVRKPEQINNVFKLSYPDWIIHTAGITNVDSVEKNPKNSYEINVKGTKNILEECKKYNTKIIYLSSNAVFDGKNPPYKEEDEVNPVNQYGMQKVECENIIKKSKSDYVIIRPILMYGWNESFERLNPVTWQIQRLMQSEQIRMVDDIYTQPLYSVACAEAIWKIIELNQSGTFHIAGKDVVTRYDFALKIAEIFGLNKSLIVPVKSAFFKSIAPRPENTSYVTKKIQRELKITPVGIEEGLTSMKKYKF
ncbi:MAG: SDR family oxidoreductase [bacterium]|nr:SDR family oxidoreductase [bacterium]